MFLCKNFSKIKLSISDWSMDSGDCETEEDSAPEACVSPEGSLLPR